MPMGLMISGGGAKGAFAAGAVQYLSERAIRYEMVSGTSAGSIIGSCLVAGKERVMRKFYESARTQDMLTRNALNDIITGQAEAVFGFGPFRARLEGILDAAAAATVLSGQIPLFLTAVSVQTGELIYFHTLDAPQFPLAGRHYRLRSRNELISAILASCAVPVSLPVQFVLPQPAPPPPAGAAGVTVREQFVDGGVKEYSPLRVLMANGATEVIAIVLRPERSEPINAPFSSAIKVGARVIDLLTDDVGDNDLEVARLTNPAVKVTVIRPEAPLLPGDSLEFTPTEMQGMVERGYSRAKKALASPPAAPPIP